MSTVTMGLFRSFFMGSYEYTDTHGSEVPQLLDEDVHYKRIREDYKVLAETGIKTVREGVRWSTVEKETGVYDFREIKHRMEVASEVGVQQLWDLCHYGFPAGLHPSSPSFVERFATLCTAFARFYRQQTFEPLIITPINEISSLAQKSAKASNFLKLNKPANDLKYYLCKAAIAGIEAIREADPNARIMLTEPLARVDSDSTSLKGELEQINENQFSVMDIISGRSNPELGGKPEYLDILAFNYYYNKQNGKLRDSLPVENRNRKFIRLSELLNKAFERYRCPVVVSETGQFDEGRAAWITEVMDECLEAMHRGVDLQGICIYPITEIADQISNGSAVNTEVWKLKGDLNRISNNKPYVAALQQCQEKLSFENGYLREQASRYAFSFNG